MVTFSKQVYIEQTDFLEDPPKKYFRLSPGNEVRLKGAYIIKAERTVKDSNGNIIEIICTYDPKSKSGSGSPESLRKVKGTIHWVDKNNHEKISINIYDKLFDIETPDDIDSGEYKSQINKNS